MWPKVPLREVLREERERIGSFDGDSLPVLGVTNIRGVTQTGIEASADKSNYLRLRPNRFVYNPYRINVGSLGLFSAEQDGIVSPAYVVFGTSERLDTRFLFYFLKSARGNQLINFYGNRGSVRSALRFVDLCEIEVPLPPLTEQRRIVARIEAVAARIAEARSLRHQSAEQAEALFAASVSSYFGASPDWATVRAVIRARKGSVRSGPFGSQLLHEEFVGSGIAAIGTRDVQVDSFELRSGWFVTPTKFSTLKRYQVYPGDLLCTIVGASIGRFCVVPHDVPLAFTTKHVQAMTLDRSKAEPRFVCLMLNFHKRCRSSLFSRVEGSAQPSLNADKVLSTELPLPPPAEQREIVSQLDALQARVNVLKRLQAETVVELDALLPSVLHRAFKGEL